MNVMVDTIINAVEAAIVHGNKHPGGIRRFIVQGAVRRALHDIHDHHTPLRRAWRLARPSGPQFAPNVCP
ncbi:hypothetical protein BDA96_05G133300 [Sorghum bicolor]|uniref:Uncharacterized protein n=2 Tax=Sorghum bicolor TaxID=4558 RepID=A0A921QWU4_SORBI|nr:hypothetical protein BDA96_05G133300 [Sorghum bicolor]OQU83464.1 hypothetical protein SORBI_3005G120433 [Sorghum bicolor]